MKRWRKKSKNAGRARICAHARRGYFFGLIRYLGGMGAEKKKSTEQIVDFPVANLSIVTHRSNKELSGDILLWMSNNLQGGCSGLESFVCIISLINADICSSRPWSRKVARWWVSKYSKSSATSSKDLIDFAAAFSTSPCKALNVDVIPIHVTLSYP